MKNLPELSEKIRYYLSHEEERLEIAIRGYEKAAKYHSYETRLAQMIKILTDSLEQT